MKQTTLRFGSSGLLLINLHDDTSDRGKETRGGGKDLPMRR